MYLGIDVHKRYAQVAVMDEAGKIVEEVRVENANLDDLAQRYAGAQAVLEATSNYYHIRDTLSEHLDVTVAHPKKINQIADTDKKTALSSSGSLRSEQVVVSGSHDTRRPAQRNVRRGL